MSATSTKSSRSSRMRLRELLPELRLGDWQPGPLNSLTDVPGVKVHTQEIYSDDGSVNTGVTSILPRDDWFSQACYSGIFKFNGSGEMTGSHWINETGLLHSPIVITNSFAVGAAYQGIYEYTIKKQGVKDGQVDWFLLPVVAETFDGYLNNLCQFAVKPEHIVHGLENVSSERVAEGCVGGGTGMICHYFKGGTGSSSRLVPGFDARGEPKTYTIAALVQANYGKMKEFRVGGQGHNPSGDIFLAFSTGNAIPVQTYSSTRKTVDPFKPSTLNVDLVDDTSINGLFEAAADATEEAIYNTLCMAETMTGNQGRTIEALPLDQVKEIMAKYI